MSACPDCKRPHCGAPLSEDRTDCLRAQLAAANERADREAAAHAETLDLYGKIQDAYDRAVIVASRDRDAADASIRAAIQAHQRILDAIGEEETSRAETTPETIVRIRQERDAAVRQADEDYRRAVDALCEQRDAAVARADRLALELDALKAPRGPEGK